MRAVVLVGGQGTRLRPLTLSTPKPLLPVAEVSIIERVLAHLATAGVTSAVLSMAYRPDAFLSAFPAGTASGVELTYAVEPEPLDTAGAIRFAALAAGIDDTFVVVNGDILTDLDVAALVDTHRRSGAAGTIALTPVEDPSAFGVVPTDEGGRVLAFIEKPPRHEAPTNMINAGVYVLDREVLDAIPDGRRVNIERETFPALVAEGRLFGRAFPGDYWTDTGTPALYLQASLDLLDGRRAGPPVSGAKDRDGVWTLGSSVVDGEVVAPCLVADAVFVGSGARVERSVLGAGSRVEVGAHVRDAVLLPGAVVGPGAVVERSIVGSAAHVREGAELRDLCVVQGGAVVPAGASLQGQGVPA